MIFVTTLSDYFSWIFIILFIVLIACFLIINRLSASISKIKLWKNGEFRECIQKNIQNHRKLKALDVLNMAAGLRIDQKDTIMNLQLLCLYSEDTYEIYQYSTLVEEIQRIKPFDLLPKETRPSLRRLSELCNDSNQESDQELLQPLINSLSKYQDLLKNYSSIRRWSKLSHIVALMSFCVGITSLFIGGLGPNKDFIQEEIKQATEEIITSIKQLENDKEL